MNELQQAMITISSSEFTNWGLKIKCEKGLVYNIPQFKKGTEEETAAYKYITSLPKNGIGLTKGIKFVVVPNNQGGQSRYIRIMEDVNAQTMTPPQATQSTQNNQTSKAGYTQKNETDWDKINKEKNESIRWLNSLNNSCLLVCKLNTYVEMNKAELKSEIISLANWLYTLEPTKDTKDGIYIEEPFNEPNYQTNNAEPTDYDGMSNEEVSNSISF